MTGSSGKALVGSATRYIAGRNAIQTVYWRGTADAPKLIKVSKTLQFKSESPSKALQQARTMHNNVHHVKLN